MEGTVEEARAVFRECLDIISDRESKYGQQWREEDIEELFGNVSRKFKGVEYQFKNNGRVDLEFPLDLINYTIFLYLRLKSENKGL